MTLSTKLTRRLDAAGIPYDPDDLTTSNGRAQFALDTGRLVPFNPRDSWNTPSSYTPNAPPRWTRARVEYDTDTIRRALDVLQARRRFKPPAIDELRVVPTPPLYAPVQIGAGIEAWTRWADTAAALALAGDLASETMLAAVALVLEHAALVLDDLERHHPTPRTREQVRKTLGIAWTSADEALRLLDAARLVYAEPSSRGPTSLRYGVIGTPAKRRLRTLL